ncbi:hypothetical protein JCM15519_16370 [Fundidesulfovibrio butyratiphilus]
MVESPPTRPECAHNAPAHRPLAIYVAWATAIFFLCMLPSVVLFLNVRAASFKQMREHFEADASLSATLIEGALFLHLVDVSALGRFLDITQPPRLETFAKFIQPVLSEHGGAQAYEWIPLVPADKRREFEDTAGALWRRPIPITQRLADGSLAPSDPKPVYYPVLLIEPYDSNSPALGFDLGSSPSRLQALEAARDSGFPMASARVKLVQDVGSHYGFLLFYPVYASAKPLLTVEQRREALLGFALGVFRYSDMLQNALSALRNRKMGLELRDLSAPEGEQLLYSDFGVQWGLSGESGSRLPENLFKQDLTFAGRKWQIWVMARQAYVDANKPWSYWLILPAGGVISLMVSVFLTALILNKARLERRTAALAEVNECLETEANERKQALRSVDQVLTAVSAILIGVDNAGKVTKWNASAEQALAMPASCAMGRMFALLSLPWDKNRVREAMATCLEEQRAVKVSNLALNHKGAKEAYLLLTVNPIMGDRGEFEGFLLLGDDITELKHLETQLIHSQKLESIGQLAAGIAHEINTPIQYVSDSTQFLKEAFTDVGKVLVLDEKLSSPDLAQADVTATAQAIREELESIDYEFLKIEVPKSFVRVQDGIERVSTIVAAMKRFSHPGGEDMQLHDLNKALENTLVVSRNEWKYVADVVKKLDPELPLVSCVPGDINQVLLNIVVNAAHAIGDVVKGTANRGTITVSTRHEPGWTEVSVSDTGTGIPAANREKVFDPFFTTKEVGKGTGQGLAIAYDIVVKKHGGQITFDSEEGRGTTFHIRLPDRAEGSEDHQGAP